LPNRQTRSARPKASLRPSPHRRRAAMGGRHRNHLVNRLSKELPITK
jgi:hypothetical protein